MSNFKLWVKRVRRYEKINDAEAKARFEAITAQIKKLRSKNQTMEG